MLALKTNGVATAPPESCCLLDLSTSLPVLEAEVSPAPLAPLLPWLLEGPSTTPPPLLLLLLSLLVVVVMRDVAS
jgi:hypothetical protein